MEILNIILAIISIGAAIVTSLFVYRILQGERWGKPTIVLCCVVSALLGGALWLPATIILAAISVVELRTT